MRHKNQQKEFLEIIRKYLKGEATEEQLDFIKKYYGHFEGKEDVLGTLPEKDREYIGAQIESAIMEKMHTGQTGPVRYLWRSLLIGTAAVVLIALSIGLYFNYPSADNQTAKYSRSKPAKGTAPDIAPGGNKATLRLADGSVISLNDIKEGEITEQSGIRITKAEDGLLTYTVVAGGQNGNSTPQFNTISTPKGGQYRVILPDGTGVWLNAASSLKYPTAFNENHRKVDLTGEAYFEVSDQWSPAGDKIPFLVSTDKQVVEVLGTHFNINAYADEPFTKTTLLEGSVRVARAADHNGKSVVLKPGEQSTVTASSRMNVAAVNTDNVVAWKSGLFQFQNSDIASVMREFSRWYDVDVEFEGTMPDIKLWGKVYRNVNASEALRILGYFDLKYRIIQTGKNKKIIIS